MRTTVTLADDVAAEVARIRRERGVGVSEAVNELARLGMASRPPSPQYVHRTAHSVFGWTCPTLRRSSTCWTRPR